MMTKNKLIAKHLVEALRVIKDVTDMASWNMNTWGMPAEGVRCGSTRCALGHIASDPYFINEGLYLIQAAGWETILNSRSPKESRPAQCDPSVQQVSPFFRGSIDAEAFVDCTGISSYEAINLFYSYFDTPETTISKLEDMIEKYESLDNPTSH
jgi:hypothetical protein